MTELAKNEKKYLKYKNKYFNQININKMKGWI